MDRIEIDSAMKSGELELPSRRPLHPATKFATVKDERPNPVTIEITSPEVEALIRQRMEAGAFHSPEELLRAVLHEPTAHESRMGTALIEALQSCPHPEADLEPARIPSPLVRDVRL